MRMKLHLDTKIGDTVILPIYEIDYATATQTSGYSEIINGTFGDGSKYNKFQVSNNQGAITDFLSANVPRNMEDNNTNCLFPYRLRYTEELGGRYYPITWFNEGAFTKLETQPTDWGLSYKYLKYQSLENARYLYSPHDAGNNGSVDQFSANNCYTDNNRTFIRRYVTESNAYFACGQGYGYGGYTSYAIIYPLCMSIGTPTTGSPYNNSQGFYFHDTAGNSANIGIIKTGNNTAQNPPYSTGYARTPICIHYVKDNTDFYGVAIVEWSSFDSDNFPTSITVLGITNPFWGASIISGGESGAGSWGSNNQPVISNGTFSGRSDSITRDPSDTHSATNIIDTVNNSVKELFYNNNQNGYPSFNTFLMTYVDNSNVLRMLGALMDPDTWSAWNNKLYNPLSGVLGFGLVPNDFISFTEPAITKELWISGINISEKIKDKYTLVAMPTYRILQTIQHKIFDLVDLRSEPWFGGFADFAPNTKMILHLPFIGEVDINVNECMYGFLGVEYACDLTSGNVLAYIYTVDQDDNAQYIACAEGNCMYNIPLFQTSQDGSGFGKALVGFGAGVAGLLTGNIPMVVGGVGTMAYALNQTVTSPHEKTRSGNIGGNNCLMAPKEVWLEIIRPKWCENMFYQKLRGIPSEMSHYISDCGQEVDTAGNPVPTGIAYDGYIKISEIELDGVNATDAEKEEIEALLKAGVYIRGAEL